MTDMQAVTPRLLTASQAASTLSISRRKLWELTANGDICVVRIGRCVRYDPRDLDAAVREMKQNPRQPTAMPASEGTQ